jgi:hypothetical protein
MCKKLFVLLVVVALSVPAMADYIGYGNPLMIDISGANTSNTLPGWQEWKFVQAPTAVPISQQFNNPLANDPWEVPSAEFTVFNKTRDPATRIQSRNRCGGFVYVGNTGDYSTGGNGLGTIYDKVTLTGLAPNSTYKVMLWSADGPNWSMNSNNPDSKFACWSSKVNPAEWLDAHGYSGNGGTDNPNNGEPNTGGYGPKWSIDTQIATTESNMPAGLAALVGDRISVRANPANNATNVLGQFNCVNQAIIYAHTNSDGACEIYGWIDMTDWTGSAHMPLNGLYIVPEPATIALLGLGGLALIRRKRA